MSLGDSLSELLAGEEDIGVGCFAFPCLASDPESAFPFGAAVLIRGLEALDFRGGLGA